MRPAVSTAFLAQVESSQALGCLDDASDAADDGGQIVPDVLPQHPQLPRGRTHEPQEAADRGRLTSAVGPEESEYPALRNLKVEAVDRADGSLPQPPVVLPQ